MSGKIVRQMDELRRIVLPQEYISVLQWAPETKVSVVKEGDRLILQADNNSCFLCGTQENIIPVKSRFVCKSCVAEIKRET